MNEPLIVALSVTLGLSSFTCLAQGVCQDNQDVRENCQCSVSGKFGEMGRQAPWILIGRPGRRVRRVD